MGCKSYGDADAAITAAMHEARGARQVIVSRHQAGVDFIRKEVIGLGPHVPVLQSAHPEDIRGAVVYGNIPLHLAAEAVAVYAIEFQGQPPRGTEYTLDDMRKAGAVLRGYTVLALPI